MPNAILGKDTLMGFDNAPIATAYGTAVDLTTQAGSKLCGMSFTPEFSAEQFEANNIGCANGAGFVKDIALGNFQYPFTLAGDFGFQNGADRILANFFGTVTNDGEQNVGDGDYLHQFTFNATANARFGCFAAKRTSTQVLEFASVYVEQVEISFDSVGQYLQFSSMLRASKMTTTGETNTTTKLAALTMGSDEKIRTRCTNYFRIKELLDDGTDTALDADDQYNITGLTLTMERPMEQIDEATGADCSRPVVNDQISATLTLNIKEVFDLTKYNVANWQAEQHFYCEFYAEGSDIGDDGVYFFKMRIPKMKMVDAPDTPVTEEGRNEGSISFAVMSSDVVNSNAGFATTELEIDICNERSANYLS